MAEVAVCDLLKSYGNIQAVRGISFEVSAGEIFGLLGPNGAGKTTTLECILGLRQPDGGSITVAGIDAVAHPGRAREIIGAALQFTGLQDKITPREAVQLFGSFYRNPIKTNELIDRFSLVEKADAPLDTLSAGQRQRLALALAFVNNPKLVFLDEPTAGLDPKSRRELHAVINQLRDEKRTVILTTHYIEEVHQLCDRLAIIDHGRVIAIGKPDDLIADSKKLLKIIVRSGKLMDVSLLPAAVATELKNGAWHIQTANVTETIAGLMKRLEADGNHLVDLQIHRPTLEDVFIELTGNSLEND